MKHRSTCHHKDGNHLVRNSMNEDMVQCRCICTCPESGVSEEKPENKILTEWIAIRKAWEELTKYASEIRGFTNYLSFEQKRELERLNEDIRAFERNLKKL